MSSSLRSRAPVPPGDRTQGPEPGMGRTFQLCHLPLACTRSWPQGEDMHLVLASILSEVDVLVLHPSTSPCKFPWPKQPPKPT